MPDANQQPTTWDVIQAMRDDTRAGFRDIKDELHQIRQEIGGAVKTETFVGYQSRVADSLAEHAKDITEIKQQRERDVEMFRQSRQRDEEKHQREVDRQTKHRNWLIGLGVTAVVSFGTVVVSVILQAVVGGL